jgi:hypothetical protein
MVTSSRCLPYSPTSSSATHHVKPPDGSEDRHPSASAISADRPAPKGCRVPARLDPNIAPIPTGRWRTNSISLSHTLERCDDKLELELDELETSLAKTQAEEEKADPAVMRSNLRPNARGGCRRCLPPAARCERRLYRNIVTIGVPRAT